jgi:hypothetical protein
VEGRRSGRWGRGRDRSEEVSLFWFFSEAFFRFRLGHFLGGVSREAAKERRGARCRGCLAAGGGAGRDPRQRAAPARQSGGGTE